MTAETFRRLALAAYAALDRAVCEGSPDDIAAAKRELFDVERRAGATFLPGCRYRLPCGEVVVLFAA